MRGVLPRVNTQREIASADFAKNSGEGRKGSLLMRGGSFRRGCQGRNRLSGLVTHAG